MNPSSASSHWLALPDSYRALIVRNRVDMLRIAIDTQHERLLATPRLDAVDLAELPMKQHLQGFNDLDFFLTALRRLHRAVDLSRSCDATGTLRIPIKLFEKRVAGVTVIRGALEHFDAEDRCGRVYGLGIGMSQGTWLITYGDDIMLDTAKLVMAAHGVHQAIRSVVDPEAARDPHAGAPMIELNPSPGGTA